MLQLVWADDWHTKRRTLTPEQEGYSSTLSCVLDEGDKKKYFSRELKKNFRFLFLLWTKPEASFTGFSSECSRDYTVHHLTHSLPSIVHIRTLEQFGVSIVYSLHCHALVEGWGRKKSWFLSLLLSSKYGENGWSKYVCLYSKSYSSSDVISLDPIFWNAPVNLPLMHSASTICKLPDMLRVANEL